MFIVYLTKLLFDKLKKERFITPIYFRFALHFTITSEDIDLGLTAWKVFAWNEKIFGQNFRQVIILHGYIRPKPIPNLSF